jgi:acyl-coenzyme A synthetase/AMP-(fatty) acid ligase
LKKKFPILFIKRLKTFKLIRWNWMISERVVDHEQLRGVRFIENIPRNKLGKIQRHQLVAKLQGESTSSDRSI